jgi:hypothetical protein
VLGLGLRSSLYGRGISFYLSFEGQARPVRGQRVVPDPDVSLRIAQGPGQELEDLGHLVDGEDLIVVDRAVGPPLVRCDADLAGQLQRDMHVVHESLEVSHAGPPRCS